MCFFSAVHELFWEILRVCFYAFFGMRVFILRAFQRKERLKIAPVECSDGFFFKEAIRFSL